MKKCVLYLLAVLTISCGDFDGINTDPDASTSVPPAFLATNAILSVTQVPGGKWYLGDSWLMKQTTYTEVMEEYLYNLFERSDFGSYAMLVNTDKMVTFAEESDMSDGVKNAYKGLDRFIQAYTFYGVTMDMGDVPCSEALKSEMEGIHDPKYDTQEQVLESVLRLLKESSDLFAVAENFDGDPIYKGDVSLWRKVVNSFTLRVLNMVNKKEKVGDVNVRDRFEEVASLPLLESEEESFMRVYVDKASQWHPFYYKHNHYVYYSYMSSYLVDLLKELNDYRLFYYAEPAENLLSEHNADNFDAYCGVDVVMPYGDVQDQCNAGGVSRYNQRYTQVPEGEPTKYVSYSDQEFILAEAALRGWRTPESAKVHYENGVRAAMSFTAKYTPNQYRHGVTVDDAYIDNYLAGEAAFNPSKGLEQILTQKYLGSLLQMPWNSYYDYRRTGFPEIPINPETNLNAVKEQMPLRWMYPSNEYSLNKEHVMEALQRQFGGSDTPNGVMWILKE